MMDKSWIHLSRLSNAYLSGAAEFLDFAFANASNKGRILCPCKKCNNNFWVSRQEAYDHIVCDGFNTSYTHWRFHGEATSSSMPPIANCADDDMDQHDDMHRLLHDAFGFSRSGDQESDAAFGPTNGPNTEAHNFFKLVEDADQELYPGCKKFSKLSFTVAKGAIFSKDPLTKVGGLELGTGFWEVSIQVAMVRKEPLIRPHGRYKTIGDAIGSTIAWPISLCMVESRDG